MSAATLDETLLSLYQQGRHHEVISQAQAQAVSPESHPLAAQVLAASLFQLADYGQAATLLEALEASLSQDSHYLSLYGATCRRLGQLQKAEQLLRRAMDLSGQAPEIRNNYANLLIDLGRTGEARALLEGLIAENPSYQDAQINLNRLRFRDQERQVQAPVSSDPSPALASSAPGSHWTPADPLMMAFSEEEVQADPLKPAAASSSSLAASLPDPRQGEMAAEQLRLAAQAVSEGNSTFALDLCSQALTALGANASLYVHASDAYIQSQRFHEAEICLLHAVAIGGPAINHLINLVSLASMRGDLVLAAHYLDQAAGLDPTHPQLAAVRRNLDHRRQTLAGRAYRFEPIWASPNLTPKG